MSVVRISAWFCRFGNNVQQIMRAVCVAERLGARFVRFPPGKHYMVRPAFYKGFALRPDGPGGGRCDDDAPVVAEGRFFYARELRGFNADTSIAQQRRLAQKYAIHEVFRFSVDDGGGASADTLFYMRGQDVFKRKPHASYVQYPRYFVSKVLEHRGKRLEDVVRAAATGDPDASVVAQIQDLRNPLARWWKDAGLVCNDLSSSLCEAITAMLHCKAIAFGVSTLPIVAVVFSKHLEQVFLPDYFHLDVAAEGIRSTVVALPGYTRMGEWRADEAQTRAMLEYEPL